MTQFETYLAIYSAFIGLTLWAVGFGCWTVNQIAIFVTTVRGQAKSPRQHKLDQAIMYLMLTGMIPALTAMIVVWRHLGK